VIVTNRHVVEGARYIEVGFPDGQQFLADVVAEDGLMDLAVLKVRSPRDPLPVLNVHTEPYYAVDEEVYYIGNPMLFHRIVGKGTVLGLSVSPDQKYPFLVIHADIFRGNSGSPVITMDGRVIGVIFAMADIVLDGERSRVGLAVTASYLPNIWSPETSP